jgi:chromate transporter
MTYINLYLVFFVIGLFGFGGGYAILPLIFQYVQEFGYMSAGEFSNLVALSQITPGPVAVNAATYVGFNTAGFFGAMAATLGITTPSFVLVLIVIRFMEAYRHSKGLNGVLQGIRPATAGLILSAAFLIAQTAIVEVSLVSEAFWKNPGANFNLLPFLIFLCTIFLIGKLRMNPILITIIMGTIGAFLCG